MVPYTVQGIKANSEIRGLKEVLDQLKVKDLAEVLDVVLDIVNISISSLPNVWSRSWKVNFGP